MSSRSAKRSPRPRVPARRKPMTKLVPARAVDREIIGRPRHSFSRRPVNGAAYTWQSAEVFHGVIANRFVAAERDPPPRFSLRDHFDASVIFENIDVV
jgi:hypothetical protein